VISQFGISAGRVKR
jgi:hypothetical protein